MLGNVCLCVSVCPLSLHQHAVIKSNDQPGNLEGDRSSFLIRWDNLICMLFIVHENPAHYSSHQHTHAQACKYCQHANFLIWFTRTSTKLADCWIIWGEEGRLGHSDIKLTSWPGIWTRCRSALQTRQRCPAAPHRSKPSMHHPPESLGFLPRRLPPHQLRSERCSKRRKVEETNISSAQRTK